MRTDHEVLTEDSISPRLPRRLPARSLRRRERRAPAPITLRGPRETDAAPMWELVKDGGSLDVNSPYLYLLICTDHADTSVVATDADGDLVGFVAAYRPPPDPSAVFVWQVGVAPKARGRGLGRRLLLGLLAREANRDARELTATVTPDNAASLALFRGVGRDLGASVQERERFPAGLFPDGADEHEPEMELRVGPLPAATPGRATDLTWADPSDDADAAEVAVAGMRRAS
jgi:L-2,4-diaminobutyric acid acetyltransferase